MASERDYEKLTTAELFLAAICAGVARWETFSTGQSGEVCVRSMRWAVKLTSRGIPDLDDHPVRVELLRALQEASRG